MSLRPTPVPFDEAGIGQFLVVTVDDTILQTSSDVDAHRLARSLYGQSAAASSVEFYLWSPNASNPSLAPVAGVPPLLVGICYKLASLAGYLGEDVYGLGFCPGDGNVYQNGAVVATFTPVPLNSYVTVAVNFIDLTVTWSVGSSLLGTITIPSGFAIYYAATVSGVPGDLAVQANANQTPPVHKPGLGWYHAQIGLTPQFIGTEPYMSAPTDAAPNFRFAGDLDRYQAPMSIARGVTPFWPWGASKPPQMGAASRIQFTILDPQKKYTQFNTEDLRNQLAIVTRLAHDSAMASAESIVTGIIDKVDHPTDQTITVSCGDKLILMQSQLWRPQFAPNADVSVAGKPYPMLLGIGRTIVGAMYDTVAFDIALDNFLLPLTGVGKGLRQGVEMGYGIDFTILPDGSGFSLAVAPVGKTTFEVTNYGGSFDPGAVDVLGGDGLFGSCVDDGGGITATSTTSVATGTGAKAFNVGSTHAYATGSAVSAVSRGSGESMTGTVTSYIGSVLTINATSASGSGTHTDWDIHGGVNQPHNWTGGGGYPKDPATQIFQVKGTGPNKYIEQEQKADAVYWMQHATATLAAGRSCAYEVVVKQAPYHGAAIGSDGLPTTVDPSICVFAGITGFAQFGAFDWGRFAVPDAGTYRGTFTNIQNATLPISFGVLCNALIEGSGGVFSYLQISSIKLVSLPAITQNVLLAGPGLDWLIQRLLIDFGPYDASDYDPSGAVAIDAATNYQCGVYVKESETPQVGAVAKPIMDSFCGGLIVTRKNLIKAFRLEAPELMDSSLVVGTLTEDDIVGYLQPYEDMAEGLTTRIMGGANKDPYAEADFNGISLSDVPTIVRKKLELPYQWTETSSAVLAPRYAAAMNANPLASIFDLPEHGRAEITRVCSLYSVDRAFYVGQYISQLGRPQFEIGQVWNVVYPGLGLENGRQLLLVWIPDEQPSEGLSQLIFWGLQS
jgi:hypothetical protein